MATAFLLSGCRAIDIGQPTVTRRERVVCETAPSPRIEVSGVRMVHYAASDGTISVGLVADVRDEFARTSHKETDVESKQKRLAFGFFPAAAELYCVPDKAVRPACFKRSYPATFLLGLPFSPLGTLRSLFLELPAGSYDCSKGKARDAFSHVGILGFHKYTSTSRWVEAGPKRPEAPQIAVSNSVPVPGPYEVEFTIPDIGQRPQTSVAKGDGRAIFSLPAVTCDQTVRVHVVFRHSTGLFGQVPQEYARQVLDMVAGRRYEFDLTLKGDGLKRIQTPEKGDSAPAYKILDVRPENHGRYVVRVEVLDKSKTLDIALRIIQPDVRRHVRENFQANNSTDPAYIRECLQYETEEDGRILVFTGWAFSVRPAEDGWSYDANTRRGWVCVRIAGGIPAEDAKRWARENIESVIRDKNIVVPDGGPPPPGAKYRSLGETLEKGILKVEFEATE